MRVRNIQSANGKRIIEAVFFLVILAMLASGIHIAFSAFRNEMKSAVRNQNEFFIKGSTIEIKNNIDDSFARGIENITAFAYLFQQSPQQPDTNYSVLNTVEREGQFDSIRYIDESGNSYTSDGPLYNRRGEPVNLADKEYYINGMAGKSGICPIQKPDQNYNAVIVFYAPVINNNERGVLLGAYDNHTMNKLLSKYYFGYKSDTFLLDRRGSIITKSVSDPLSRILNNAEPDNIDSVLNNRTVMNKRDSNAIRNAYENMTPVSFSFNGSFGEGMGYYVNLESTDLLLGHTFPSGAVKDMNRNISVSGNNLRFKIVIMFALYVLLIISYLTFKNVNLKSIAFEEYAKARKDILTGLKNRLSFEEDCAYIEENRLAGKYTVVSADLNNLKVTNDAKGHSAGDELISGAAEILKSCFTKYGNVYRIGGDEFVALIICSRSEMDKSLIMLKRKQQQWQGKYSNSISIAIGIVMAGQYENMSIYKLVRKADKAMYEDKKGCE